MFDQDQRTQLRTLAELNGAINRLATPIPALTLVGMAVPGATNDMLNEVIAADKTALYDTMGVDELPDLATPLGRLVDSYPIAVEYDPHGDKHFPGGRGGSRFAMGTDDKSTVNTYLQNKIDPLRGRIRRDANGHTRTYYLTEAPDKYTGQNKLTVQVDYIFSPEKICFHGYPDSSVTVYSLSRTKGGSAIP